MIPPGYAPRKEAGEGYSGWLEGCVTPEPHAGPGVASPPLAVALACPLITTPSLDSVPVPSPLSTACWPPTSVCLLSIWQERPDGQACMAHRPAPPTMSPPSRAAGAVTARGSPPCPRVRRRSRRRPSTRPRDPRRS